MSSLGHASSGTLGYLQSSTFVAAAAAAAAAAATLNSSNLLLGASPAQHYQQMMLAGGDEALLQAAGSGLLPDAASALCGSSWLNSNSDPSLLNSLTASGRQLSATSPVPMPQPYSSAGSAGGRAFRSSLPAGSMMGVPIDQSAAMAAAAAAGLDPSLLAGMQGMPLSHQLSGSSVSLAGAAGMAGKAAGLAGSAPAGYGMLGNDLAGSAYQQQLLQQLQMEQHHQQQQQMSQQQMLQEQLALQQQLQALIQQQAMAAATASSSGLQQLVQQQQAQLQLQQMAAVQQQQQQWHSSMLASQPVAASAPASQLLWQQQQQQLEVSQMQPGSYGSSSSMTPPDSTLAAVLGGVGSRPTQGMSPTQRVACTAPPAYGMGQQQQQQQQPGMLKWSSSVLSKRGSSQTGSSSGQDAVQRQVSLEAPGGRDAAVAGLLGGPAAGMPAAFTAAAGAGGMLAPAGSSGMVGSATLDQLNGLLQMVHVTSSAAMAGPGGLGF
jgi:hypothetical protein